MLPGGGFVVLDTAVTPELRARACARDLVRAVQQARRDAGLDVSDRIALTVGGPADLLAAARTHQDLVRGETLATSLTYDDGDRGRRSRWRRHDAAPESVRPAGRTSASTPSHGQAALGAFWAAVIGLDVETSPGKVSLDGSLPSQRVWINEVDRPKRGRRTGSTSTCTPPPSTSLHGARRHGARAGGGHRLSAGR